ncbi:MAG: excinuclease ABC, C subunit [Candidatus Xenolissoclinum pacificiensis L6]|uniref:UvrABC system protein C n=1 Tax=Candidatus Xenolissoclinum pacificiensis L6 TaxID=1401685 RepID=W2UY61_9RICK|nr:MAG: excinuclease ABC, C subunit [Candidatus Xenolissoclinum pacificiensis L6]
MDINYLPMKPGVYKMIDCKKKIIYVGMSKNIKSRVLQHINNPKAYNMISQVHKIQYIITSNHIEALILEAKIIRQYQPRYNVLLKDDKSFPHIFIGKNHHMFPRIYQGRQTDKHPKHCFGPFTSNTDVRNIIRTLQETFLIRSCADPFFQSRTRPCMEYEIKRCSAPCVGYISEQEYNFSINRALRVLKGDLKSVEKSLWEEMYTASKKRNYERAGLIRDRIRSLLKIHNILNIENKGHFIGHYFSENRCCIHVIISEMDKVSNYQYFFDNTYDKNHVMDQFLLQFYLQRQHFNECIYISYPISQTSIEALQSILPNKNPLIYDLNNKMVNIACNTARDNLMVRLRKEKFHIDYLLQIQALLKLPYMPEKIEVYDNSHHHAIHAIGVMIVVDTNGFNKKLYRKFNLAPLHKGNDYSMMSEVLTRRMKKTDTKPDVIFLDGGPGHIHIGLNLLQGIRFACIAKGTNRNQGNETLYLDDGSSVKLQKQDKLLFFLQRIRDESHRFAITSHRKKHNKHFTQSILEQIEGIGKTLAKRLLYHFSSIDEISEQSCDALQKIPGINKKVACNIYLYFQDTKRKL